MVEPGVFRRHTNPRGLTPDEKRRLIQDYLDHYRSVAAEQPESLNRKISGEAFSRFLEGVGVQMLEEAERLAADAGPVRDFLDENPPPKSIEGYLPGNFRAFCLLL